MRYGDFVNALAFSPDNKRVAATGYGVALRVWDVLTTQTLLSTKLDEPSDTVSNLQFSPSGRYLLAGPLLWDFTRHRRAFDFNLPFLNGGSYFDPALFVRGHHVLGLFWPNSSDASPLLASVALRTRRLSRGGRIRPGTLSYAGGDGGNDQLKFSPQAHFLLREAADRTSLQCVPIVQDLRHFKARR